MDLGSQHGFALIEQVIILAIISLLSVTAIVAFTDVTVVQKQKTVTRDLYYNIRKIQNYALTGRQEGDIVGVKYYGLHIKTNHDYVVFVDTDGNEIYTSSDMILDTITLPFGISLEPVGGTLTSILPQGTFCYTKDNTIGLLNCTGTTSFHVNIDNTQTSNVVDVNHLLGNVSYEE